MPSFRAGPVVAACGGRCPARRTGGRASRPQGPQEFPGCADEAVHAIAEGGVGDVHDNEGEEAKELPVVSRGRRLPETGRTAWAHRDLAGLAQKPGGVARWATRDAGREAVRRALERESGVADLEEPPSRRMREYKMPTCAFPTIPGRCRCCGRGIRLTPR